MARSRRPSRSDEVRRFRRAAAQRFEEAQFLLARSDYTTAAVYLAGYGVECGLKALLLSKEPASRFEAVLTSFRGSRAHDFDWLKRELYRRGATFPPTVVEQIAKLTWWSTDLRYEPGRIPRRTAEDFLATAEETLGWVIRSL